MRNELVNRNYFDSIFDSFFGEEFLPEAKRAALAQRLRGDLKTFAPKVDVISTKTALQIKAELPGIDEQDVEVTLDKDQLIIRGEKRQEAKQEEGTEFYFEQSYGKFERRLTLPKEIDREQINAAFKNGVLTVTIPRSKEALDVVKKIAINGSQGAKH